MDTRVATRSRNALLTQPSLILARIRQDGVVTAPAIEAERRMSLNPEYQNIVDMWPISRIRQLENRCSVPRTRIAALLGIGASIYKRLVDGTYTPSPILCNRMAELERMADEGLIHGEYIPEKVDLQRRITLFRAWFNQKAPTADFPIVTVRVKFQWGPAEWQSVVLPIDHLPRLRLTKWSGLGEIVRNLTVALKTLARQNNRLMWKQMDAEFWHRYSTETLPKIVEDRAKSMEARLEKGRKKRGF